MIEIFSKIFNVCKFINPSTFYILNLRRQIHKFQSIIFPFQNPLIFFLFRLFPKKGVYLKKKVYSNKGYIVT